MGSGPSKPIDIPGDEVPEEPTTTKTRSTQTSSTSSTSTTESTTSETTTETLSSSTSTSTTESTETPPTTSETSTTLSTITHSDPDPTPTIPPILTDESTTVLQTGTLDSQQAGTASNSAGPNVVAIVIPVIIASLIIGALAAIFLMRRRRRNQSSRLLEDFQRRHSMSVGPDGEDKYYHQAAQKPYAPQPHATYAAPSMYAAGSPSVYEASAAAYAPAAATGWTQAGYPQQSYGAASFHAGIPARMDGSDVQSLRSTTTARTAGRGAHPLSPGAPLNPSMAAVAWSTTPAPPTGEQVLTLGGAAIARSPSVHTVGTVASADDRRQLRITNARSDASLEQPTLSPGSVNAEAGPKTGKDKDELGAETLKAWLQD
ncbi:hypothetical protein BKA62DRAFT_203449 [Auriculariales sp. MPI-PUGE-AT-0066]|nr:hypothetical protein BKA62DRAFT_203449 [Auriculariales sp. MPI-PUGE-AT-0066]